MSIACDLGFLLSSVGTSVPPLTRVEVNAHELESHRQKIYPPRGPWLGPGRPPLGILHVSCISWMYLDIFLVYFLSVCLKRVCINLHPRIGMSFLPKMFDQIDMGVWLRYFRECTKYVQEESLSVSLSLSILRDTRSHLNPAI